MLTIGAFLADNWPTILEAAIVLLPTLIVGFTKYPRVDNALSIVLKILNAVSVVSHSDSPGTFKPPIAQSQPPPDHLGFSRLGTLAVLWIATLSVLASCAYFGPHFKQDEIDCGKAALHEAADKILPDVTLILSDPNVAFAQALAALETTAGDAVVCAVAVAVKDFEATAHPAAQEPQGASAQEAEASIYSKDLAIVRGHQYLSTHKTPVLPGQ